VAEIWLSVYETVERHTELFERVAVLRHRDLVADPATTLASVHQSLGLEPQRSALSTRLEHGRNRRWREVLNDEQRQDLEAFISEHRPRIEALRLADTTL
jgi:hypothetical protein